MAEKTNVPTKTDVSTPRRWDPFERLQELQDEMARLWSDTWPFTARSLTPPALRETSRPTPWAPRLDVYEKNGNLVIKADLPGAKPEDVEVTLEEGDLIIKGERKDEREDKAENYYRMERSYGSFYRCLSLPEGIKPEQIQATFADGVLEITIPKPTEKSTAAQKITISSK